MQFSPQSVFHPSKRKISETYFLPTDRLTG